MLKKHEAGFAYDVSVNITLTVDDLRLIKRASEKHYDGACQGFFSDTKPTTGNYWTCKFPMNIDGEVDWVDPFDEKVPGGLVSEPICATFDDLDLVSKVLEATARDPEEDNAARGMTLRIQLKRVINDLREEQMRMLLKPLYEERNRLAPNDKLSPEQIERLGIIQRKLDRLESVYSGESG